MNFRGSWRPFLLVAWLTAVTVAEESQQPIRQGPQRLADGVLNLGTRVPDFSFVDIFGHPGRLSQLEQNDVIVLAMTGTGCPLCQKYAPTLAAVERAYAHRKVAFLFLNPNASEAEARLQAAVQEQGLDGPYVRDDTRAISRLLEVRTTTEVFVLDRARTLVYRGAVDDQYGLGYALETPRTHYLTDAIEAVLRGETPSITATTAPGCELFYSAETDSPPTTQTTYHNRISRIIQRNCLECHRQGGVAPMPLSNYAEVRDYAGMIRSVVEREVMPPWFAANNAAAPYRDNPESAAGLHTPLWANARLLSASERSDLKAWIAAGAPEGDPSDAPLPREFADGWLAGQPDAVFQFPQAIPIKATGILPYKNVVVETNLPEDRWVQSIEIVPGDPSVVHHVLVFVLPPDGGKSNRTDGVNYWGIYVPGNSTQIYPSGYARRLPKHARLKFQMHYTTNGRATEDRTKIGLVFAKQPPQFEVKTWSIVNHRFRIPPQAANFRVTKISDPIPRDTEVLGYLPHHHLRGKACRFELTTPTGEQETLLDVPRYDFNWQLFYQYAHPRVLPQGSRIEFTAWYDNSAGNPANPDPTREVGWGEQTNDEMHLGYVEYVVPVESPDISTVP